MSVEEATNLPVLWIFVVAAFGTVIAQAVIFLRISRGVAVEEGLTRKELRTSVRTGAISAIGPSLAIALVAIGLISVFGAPAALLRVGLVGSLPYELAAAAVGAESYGVTLGGEGYDATAFATVFFTMAFGAGVWMLMVIFFTKSMGTMSAKLSRKSPLTMQIVPGAAMLAAFAYLCLNQVSGGSTHVIVMIGAALVMVCLLVLATRLDKPWIREWALGLSMTAGVTIAALVA